MAKRAERRKEILDAARRLFSEKGYNGVSLGDIAEKAGLSVGLIYYVFPKKEDILLGVIQEASLRYQRVFERSQELTDPVERLDMVLRESYQLLDDGCRVLMILYKDLSSINKETRVQILDLERQSTARMAEIIEDGKQKGVFKPSVPSQLVAFNLIGIGHLWALKKTWLFGNLSFTDFLREQQQLFHSMLLL